MSELVNLNCIKNISVKKESKAKIGKRIRPSRLKAKIIKIVKLILDNISSLN